MIRVRQLRHKAELLEQVASIPTNDDRLIDWELSVLADQLEEEADAMEECLKRQSARRPRGDGGNPPTAGERGRSSSPFYVITIGTLPQLLPSFHDPEWLFDFKIEGQLAAITRQEQVPAPESEPRRSCSNYGESPRFETERPKRWMFDPTPPAMPVTVPFRSRRRA